MILGTGIDLVDINRFKHWPENSGLCEKYFREEELDYCLHRAPRPWAALAGGFAAKESFSKALGTGMRDLKLKEIAVIRNPRTGQPLLSLYGRALETLRNRKGLCHLSLSYEHSFVIAQVLIEKISRSDGGSSEAERREKELC